MDSSLSHLIMTGAQLLVVGDQHANGRLHHLLSGAGYEVVIAANRAEALAQYDEQPIDLVLLDVMRAEGEGLALCRELRRRADVPIILLAAPHQTGAIVQGLEAGADDAIVHPFAPAELLAYIGALLRRLQWMAAGARTPAHAYLENETVTHGAGQLYVEGTAALWERPALAFAADE